MPKHHTEDYKLTAVKYYLKNNTTYKNVCEYHFQKYMTEKNNNKHYEFFSSMITFCKTYNCFNKYCKIMENKFAKLNDYDMFNLKNNEINQIRSDSELDTDSENEEDVNLN